MKSQREDENLLTTGCSSHCGLLSLTRMDFDTEFMQLGEGVGGGQEPEQRPLPLETAGSWALLHPASAEDAVPVTGPL